MQNQRSIKSLPVPPSDRTIPSSSSPSSSSSSSISTGRAERTHNDYSTRRHTVTRPPLRQSVISRVPIHARTHTHSQPGRRTDGQRIGGKITDHYHQHSRRASTIKYVMQYNSDNNHGSEDHTTHSNTNPPAPVSRCATNDRSSHSVRLSFK